MDNINILLFSRKKIIESKCDDSLYGSYQKERECGSLISKHAHTNCQYFFLYFPFSLLSHININTPIIPIYIN